MDLNTETWQVLQCISLIMYTVYEIIQVAYCIVGYCMLPSNYDNLAAT